MELPHDPTQLPRHWQAHLGPLHGHRWPIRCGRRFSAQEVDLLRQGLWPRDMDDRWAIWLGPDQVLREATQAINRALMDGGDRTERGAIKAEEVSIRTAATALGTGTLTIRRMLREGRLAATRRGRHTYVSLAAVERLRRPQ